MTGPPRCGAAGPARMLVYGMAIAGEAVARAAITRGIDVVVADDNPDARLRRTCESLGVEVFERPSGAVLDRLVASVDLVCPSPGVPEHHGVIAAALRCGVGLRSELDLAYEWEGPTGRPMVAVTGTDGKTTVTSLSTAMVRASGRRAIEAGNTDVPLVAALDGDAEVFVVEAASFRLRWLTCFRARSATWLNLAPDHLDWHGDMAAYRAAKARVWEFQLPGDASIGLATDPLVTAELSRSPGRHLTFGPEGSGAHYRQVGGELVGPAGVIIEVSELWRTFPHDLTNALAAAATVLEAGMASIDGVRSALRAFRGIAHRIALVAEAGGVRYYDDSKATTPHAVVSAVACFDSVVLIAGGRNKALDLSALAAPVSRVRAVVAIGESAHEVAAAFRGRRQVTVAESMDEAVASAAQLAQPGDAVLLSPGCASFDWYRNYAERGDDFARAVRALVGAS
jgi:UDP-N-acetylmuramoylalanine--D-glutamate ligase